MSRALANLIRWATRHKMSSPPRLDAASSDHRRPLRCASRSPGRRPGGRAGVAPEASSGPPVLHVPRPHVLRAAGDPIPVTVHLACGCSWRQTLPADLRLLCHTHGLTSQGVRGDRVTVVLDPVDPRRAIVDDQVVTVDAGWSLHVSGGRLVAVRSRPTGVFVAAVGVGVGVWSVVLSAVVRWAAR